jgi:methionyl-tRNA formyltransferase
MKVVALLNNRLGLKTLEWLTRQSDEVIALVVHPHEKARLRDELIQKSALPPERIFEATQLGDPAMLQRIGALGADIAVSVMFGYILQPEFLAMFSDGCVNLHPAMLPYNRGAHPNVWSIVDGTPAGATLHYVDAGVDTGDIIAQQEVRIEPEDTGETLYWRLESASLELFKVTWPVLSARRAPRRAQPKNVGTAHRVSDVKSIDCIDLDRTYTGRYLVNVLRARTFPPYRGAYFLSEGKRIFMSLSLEALPLEEELEQ